MVREVVFILVILVIIISANFIVINYLENSTDILISKIDEVNQNIEDKEKAEEIMEELSNEWKNANKIWAIIIPHQELDQIEISLLSAKTAIENEEIHDAHIEINKLEFLIKHINEKEEFSLKNIF